MKKKHHAESSLSILKIISAIGSATLESFFPKNYSFTLPSRKLLGLDKSDLPKISPAALSVKLSRLKAEGLVERSGSRKKSEWKITPKGKSLLRMSLEENSSSKTDDNKKQQVLVIFDVPESQRKKRYWLRAQLAGLEYKILQKSVWLGNTPLPEDFLHDADVLGLGKYMHIFSVHKSGTLSDE